VFQRLISLPEIRTLSATYVAGLAVLVGVSLPAPSGFDVGHLAFWMGVTLITASLPVRLPGGLHAHIVTGPLLATLFDTSLPQPFAVCWVAFLGTIERRDLTGRVPWYGVLFNKFVWVLSAFAAWLAVDWTLRLGLEPEPVRVSAQLVAAGSAYVLTNSVLVILNSSLRTSSPLSRVFRLSIRNITVGFVSQVPLGWLMAEIALRVGYWAALLFMVPLLLARYSFTKYTELRELFFGSVSALSQAIDAKDGFTRGHADRVSRIAGAVARDMGVPESDIEQIELAALLHDIGKIGVEDRILLKPARLDPDETELMRRHPIYGASILEPSPALRPLAPIVLAHHENYDGSGYPNGLKGERIPLGARIILVSDAYEAMTSDRIYRKAIGHEKAMEQLHKYQGVQFDPRVVAALTQLLDKRGTDAFEVSDLPAIEYETLAELRRRLTQGRLEQPSHAG
jgi:HD-GYP domain-containing protein (c-di-GMP phosphodiesterase class II)